MEKVWKEATGIGTGRKTLTESSAGKPLDKLREGLAQGQDELRLLAGAGLGALQTMAAYIPAVDNGALPQADSNSAKLAYKESHLQHLSLLQGGYHARVYVEWLHWASLSKVSLPYEAIPLLLDLGSLFPETYELTKRLVGLRGRWLVRHRDNNKWQWLNQVEVGKAPRVGKQKKQEERLISAFRFGIYYHIGSNVREGLRMLNHPWSLRFSEMLLETVLGVMKQNSLLSSVDQIDIIRLAQFNLHPHLGQGFMGAFSNYRQDPEVIKAVETMGRIIEFRMDVRESFGIVE